VLACAPSNVAVDNLLEKLSYIEVSTIKYGFDGMFCPVQLFFYTRRNEKIGRHSENFLREKNGISLKGRPQKAEESFARIK